MFVEAVMGNVVVFVVGLVFALGYLRTGRFWTGMGALVGLWVAMDWWLVARYLFAAPAAQQVLPLLMMQGIALVTAAAFVWAVVRRRLGAQRRDERHRDGVQKALRGDHAAAGEVYRGLVWTDPWDAAAWIALGDVLRRSGDAARARRCYRRAGGVDVQNAFDDLLQHRRERLAATPKPKGKATPAAETAPTAAAVAASTPATPATPKSPPQRGPDAKAAAVPAKKARAKGKKKAAG